MKINLDCYPCFFRQALESVRLCTHDENLHHEVLKRTSQFLAGKNGNMSPPVVSGQVQKIVLDVTGCADPFKDIKEMSNRAVLSALGFINKKIESSEDPLLEALCLSAQGNIMDSGARSFKDPEGDVKKIMEDERSISSAFQYEEFKSRLSEARNILFLCDNTGEIVFDRLLIGQIRKNSQAHVTAAVRENPVLNDACIKDALSAGLDDVADLMSSGSDLPSTVPGLCSEEFMDVYRQSDLVLSKGQGNYEGLTGTDEKIFFLFIAKCDRIARRVGTNKYEIILSNEKKKQKKRQQETFVSEVFIS